ncbi:MAG: MCE family protein [Desulfobacteraceae bacterium]|nr:MCE family protein [Desulfobacteraceae bacterium]
MKKDTSKTMIGAFISGAFALAIAGVLIFGGGRLFKSTSQYVIYFTGSVKGLSLGAPVQLKGVNIGTVKQINLVFNPKSNSFLNQVIFEVQQGPIKIAGDSNGDSPQQKVFTTDTAIDDMIHSGLRAKLQIHSFVTGQLLVALDFYPDTQVILRGFENDYRELPTLPSDMEALTKTLDKIDFKGIVDSISNVANGVEKLATSSDLHEIVATANDTLKMYRQLASKMSTELTVTLADISRLVKKADEHIAPLATNINATAAGIRKTLTNLDNQIQPLLKNLDQTVSSANAALEHAESMLNNFDYLSDQDSALIYRINGTLAEVKKAASALSVLADYLGRHPEAILKGKSLPKDENK